MNVIILLKYPTAHVTANVPNGHGLFTSTIKVARVSS